MVPLFVALHVAVGVIQISGAFLEAIQVKPIDCIIQRLKTFQGFCVFIAHH